MAKSMWAFSYATASFVTLVLTGVAISGAATRNRTVNIVLCLLSNHLSELPLTIMFTDACFYTWLNVTGIFRESCLVAITLTIQAIYPLLLTNLHSIVEESLLVRFFYYANIITAIGLLYLFKRSLEGRKVGQEFLDQIDRREWVELPGLSS